MKANALIPLVSDTGAASDLYSDVEVRMKFGLLKHSCRERHYLVLVERFSVHMYDNPSGALGIHEVVLELEINAFQLSRSAQHV
jgi:hypothetical protein